MTNKTLLVVDDEPDIGELVRTLAGEQGYDVMVAAGAAQAIRLCRETPPDVILMDMVMPDADGIDLLSTFAVCGIDSKIILMTGYDSLYLGMGRRLGEAKGLTIIDTIQKPFRYRELSECLLKAAETHVNRKAS